MAGNKSNWGFRHSLHDPEHWSISHHISHWWIVLIACQMTNCVVAFFSEHEQQKQLDKNFKNALILKQNNVGEKAVTHIKLTFCFQIQVHGIEENIERQQGVL